jgi:hypothetical protein
MPKYVAKVQYRGNGPQQNSLLIVEAANEDQAAALFDLAMDHANNVDPSVPSDPVRRPWSWNRLKELDGMDVMRKQEERKNRRTPHQVGGKVWIAPPPVVAEGTDECPAGPSWTGCPADAVCGGKGCLHEQEHLRAIKRQAQAGNDCPTSRWPAGPALPTNPIVGDTL